MNPNMVIDYPVRVLAPPDDERAQESYSPAHTRWLEHTPGGHQHNQLSHAGDLLNLAGRIELGDGESFVSSGRVDLSDPYPEMLYAVVDTPSGQKVRVGVIGNEDAGRWRARNLGGTADLDTGQIRRLRAELTDANDRAKQAAKIADRAWGSATAPTDPVLTGDEPVAEGRMKTGWGDLTWSMWVTDDDPAEWQTSIGVDADGENARLNPKDLRKLLAKLDELGGALEATSPALARWLEHGLHDQKSHGRRFRISGDKRSGVLPSVADLRGLAEKKGLTVPKRARRADIAKMLDDAGPRDDLFPGRPRQSEKLDAKLHAAFGPADPPAPKKAQREPKPPKTKAVWQPAGELPVTGTIVRQNSSSYYIQWDSPGASGRVERVAKRSRDWKHADDITFMSDEEFAAAHDEGLIDDPARMPGSVGAAERQATQLSDTTGRPSAEQIDAENRRQRVDRAEAAIRTAVDQLAKRADGSGWVRLSKVRAKIERGPLSKRHRREDVDAALDRMIEDPDVHVQAELNQRHLTDEDRAAAIMMGGEPRHLINTRVHSRAGHTVTSSGQPVPAASSRVDAAKADIPHTGDASNFTADQKLAAARIMFGDDESKWPAHAKRDAAKSRRAQASVDRIQDRLTKVRAQLAAERSKSRTSNLQSNRETTLANQVRKLERDLRDARRATEAADRNQLKDYWLHGEGAAKWVASPHPWTALYRHLKDHMPDEMAKRVAAEWFHDRFGIWPGERKGDNPAGPG